MRMMSSMPSIPTIGEQYANAASYAREKGVAALIATHNHELARRMDRTVIMEDGVLKDYTA